MSVAHPALANSVFESPKKRWPRWCCACSAALQFAVGALLLLLVTRCAAAPIELRDDVGQVLRFLQPAKRIVSLAPHVTELLFAAGAGPRVVAVTEFSDFPPDARKLPRVGGSSGLNLEAIVALKPNVVIAMESSQRVHDFAKLRRLGIPVFISQPHRLLDIATTLRTFGVIAGSEVEAARAAHNFEQRYQSLQSQYVGRPTVPVFLQVWHQPLYTVNGQHVISDVLGLCGGRNVFANLPAIAPVVSVESVLAAQPEAILSAAEVQRKENTAASGTNEGDALPNDMQDPGLQMWLRWPSVLAVANHNLFHVPPDLILRHSPRILDGATLVCRALEQARARRTSIKTKDSDLKARD